MVSEFVVGVAMLGAENASGSRVASRRTVSFDFDAMRQALWNVPSGVDTHCACRARGDAGSCGASRTRIEAERVAGRIDLRVDQQRGAERDPRSVNRMHRDAEDTRT